MIIFWMIAVIVFFILVTAFFSGSEMGVISVNRIKMERLAQGKVANALLLKKMLSSPDRLLSTSLVGTNLSVVISSAVFTALVVATLGREYSWLTTVIITPVILIFAEAVPKAIFRFYADTITFKIARMLRFFEIIFYPVVVLVTFISRIILFPLKTKKAKKSLFVTREELKLLIREGKQEEIKPYERAIIHRIFEFGSKKVKEIMIPIKNVVSIEAQESPARLKELSETSGYSRILVYEDRRENIIGFVNVFDALYEEGKFTKVKERLRPVLFTPYENPIDKVFYSLQLERKQIAILVDEDNRRVGIVTFKDLLDEIIGEM